MKKFIRILTLITALFFLCLPVQAAYNSYWATVTHGGTTGAMDAINGNLLNDGDKCEVKTSSGVSFYHLNATSGVSESIPNIIAPDSNPGTKRWLLSSSDNKYYINAAAADQGANTDRSIKNLVDTIGGTKKATIVAIHTGVADETTYTLTTDETIPDNITLEIENGAIFDGAGQLQIASAFNPGPYQVFSNTFSVVFRRGSVSDVYPQWWGAVGDSSTDDTLAIQAAINVSMVLNIGMNIVFLPGTYIITASLTADPDGADERTNISFIGKGGGGNMTTGGAVLKYQGTDVDGMFNLDAVSDFHFDQLGFYNDAASINQIFKIHASAADTQSARNIIFNKCRFQNKSDVTKELSNGHVWLYNALNVSFKDCVFMGSPTNVTIGCDPALTSGVAAGYAGRISFDNVFFTGDVIISRATVINFFGGTTFEERWDNSLSPFELGAKIHVPDLSYTNVSSLSTIGVQFNGMYNPVVFTPGAIKLDDAVNGVIIHGCMFQQGYSVGVIVNRTCDAIDIRGNYINLDESVSAKFLTIESLFTGRVSMENNHLSAQMILDGGSLYVDNRAAPYEWPYLVDLLATSDYTVVAGDTWEAALTSGNVQWREGMYRIRASALIYGGATHRITMRVDSSSGYQSPVYAVVTSHSGDYDQLFIDDIVYLDEETADQTWTLTIREQTAANAVVRALAVDGGIAVTYLQVLPY